MKHTLIRQSTLALSAALSTLVLTACSGIPSINDFIKGDKLDYKSAGKLPPLEIPPDLTAAQRDDRFATPDRKGPVTAGQYEADLKGIKVASNSDVLPAVQNASMERAGSQRWLVIKAKPDVLWPVVKEFWQDLGFLIKVEVADAGVMETDWAENRAKFGQDFVRDTVGKFLDTLYSTGERDKFRTRFEQSGDNTEIYISHRGMVEVYTSQQKDTTAWQPRPPDVELEAELLRRLMVRFGTEEAKSREISRSVAAAKPAERAKIIRGAAGGAVGGAVTYVEVDETFDRAWRRVGLALDRVGFTVEDRDRAKGIYFVRYADPEADLLDKKGDKGFLGKLLDFGGSNKAKPAEKYQIQVKDIGALTLVAVVGEGAARPNDVTTNRILGLLHEQLK